MLRFAICDDEEIFRKIETETISRIMQQEYEYVSYETIQYSNGEDLVKDYMVNKIDVIFLDIELGEENGFDIAYKLAKVHKDTNIVFVTTYENLVFDSFVFRPLGFVRKRVFEDEIKQVLFRMVKSFIESKQMIIFGEGKEKFELLFEEIRMIRSFRHDIIISSENGDIQIRDKLLNFEKKLFENNFISASRGCMVNLKYIRKIDGNTMYLFNDECVTIGRSRLREVKDTFKDYQLKSAKGD